MIRLRNSLEDYGAIARILHWVIAALVIIMLVLGLTLDEFSKEWKPQALNVHKSIGIMILGLVLIRVVWRLSSVQPLLPASLSKTYKFLGKLSHVLLYGLMVAMPISGWLMISARGKQVVLMNRINLPNLVSADQDLAKCMSNAHTIIGNVFIGVIILHVSAALYHHFILKDNVLRRMLPNFIASIKE